MKPRSYLWVAILALLVGGFAGTGYFARGWFERRGDLADPVVAMVNDHPIRESYVRSRVN